MRNELGFARIMGQPTWTTWALLGVIVFFFLSVSLWADILTARFAEFIDGARIPSEAVLLLGAKNNAAINDGEVWRFSTGIFLHAGIVHLLVNGYALYVLGTILERLYGARRFLLLFVFSGLAGSVASYAFTPSNSVGASGAIFGLLGAAVIFGLKFRDLLPARMRRALTLGLLPWVVINIGIGVAVPQIDNAAHMGGLIGGAIIATLLGTPLKPTSSRVFAAIQWAMLAAVVGFVLWSLWTGFLSSARCSSSVNNLNYCLTKLGVVPQ